MNSLSPARRPAWTLSAEFSGPAESPLAAASAHLPSPRQERGVCVFAGGGAASGNPRRENDTGGWGGGDAKSLCYREEEAEKTPKVAHRQPESVPLDGRGVRSETARQAAAREPGRYRMSGCFSFTVKAPCERGAAASDTVEMIAVFKSCVCFFLNCIFILLIRSFVFGSI